MGTGVRVSLLLVGLLALLAFPDAERAFADDSPPISEAGPWVADAPEVDEHRIVVRYRSNASQQAITRLESTAGVNRREHHARSQLTVLEVPAGADPASTLMELATSPLVDEAGFMRVATLFDVPNDPNYARQWHMHNSDGGLRAEGAWTLATNLGAGVVVAVIDTGVAYEARNSNGPYGKQTYAQAPDLAGVPIVAPWDFANSDRNANDDHGHGTHVAGTVLQATNNSVGQTGVAPDASLMPIKVLDYAGRGDATGLVNGIYHAIDNGADVINMSLGFPSSGSPDASGAVCTEIVGLGAALEEAHSRGVVVVAAAGNDGGSTVSCPAAYPTVIAVGATDFDGQVTFYSNRGSALDVAAPGGDPRADRNGDGYNDGVLQQTFCLDPIIMLLTGDYTQFCDVLYSGTSMATPHVAGVVALLLGEAPGLSPEQVRSYLQQTARDRGPAGRDIEYGWGVVDAVGAVAMLKGVPIPELNPPPPPITVVPVPATPSDLAAELTAATSVRLTWVDNADNEQYYHVERSTDGANFAQVALLGANTTAWTNFNLQPETTYYYRVRASASSVYSAHTEVVSITTPPPPAAPTGLQAEVLSASSIRLTWVDNATDEQYYRVERSTDGVSFSQVAVLLANTTSWTSSSLQAETTYYYRVRASVSTVYSGYSNVASATTFPPPAAPANLQATALSPSSIGLTWVDNATDEQYYRVERSTDGVSFSQVAVLLANTTSWTSSSLQAETTYYYRVRASVGTVYSPYSNVASATTFQPSAAPSNLQATALSATSIGLTWSDNASDEQYYRVERATDGINFTQVAHLSANTTAWANTSLQPESTYHYRVRASAGTVYSEYSNVAFATTFAPPAAPSGLQAEALSATSIRLTWVDNASDEQYYRVERSTDGVSFSQVALLSANTTIWTNTSLQPETTYHYRVRASAGTVYSDYSNIASATTFPPPLAPTNLQAEALSASEVRLTWVDNAGDEQYYRVERSTDGMSFSQVALLSANTTTWTNSNLQPDTTYHYRVRASAGTVYSGYSNIASATTLPPPAAPSDLQAEAISATQVRLAWVDNATDEQYYRVERSTDGISFSQVAVLLANTTSWTNSSLQTGTTYYYRVRASVGTVYSEYSNVASATPDAVVAQ